MALHLKSDFAKICGLTTGNLTNYIKRNKVVLSGDYVDDTVHCNSDFLLKRFDFVKEKPVVEKKVNEPNVSSPEIKIPKPGKISTPDDSVYGVEKQLRVQELEKKTVETRLLELKEKKLQGELIPTELVKAVFAQQTQSFITSFNNSIQDMLTLFSKKHTLNTNEISEMRGGIACIINESVDKAVDLTEKNIRNIVNEFTIKRDVGEHD